ncbi:MAG TPA: YIP1 family protein [Candidatus Eremiobacteraceae bacterium]|nr:YIP1 family protein [Candidatus Eremiobacteraceae bacterium]
MMASTTTAAPQKSNGLSAYLSILWSPATAFDQLRETPTWGWAALIGIVLLLAATLISMPEIMKVAHIAQQQQLSTMSADQQAQARQAMGSTAGIIPVFAIVGVLIVTWLIWVISAVVYAIGGAISGAGAKFSLAWVVSVNLGIIAFVGALVNAVILAARGPDAISSPLDQYALPSLGMFFHDNVKLATFLNTYNLDYLWLYVVAVIGLERTLSMKRGAAIVTVVVYSLIGAGLASAVAR